MVDYGVVLGATGLVVATVTAIYARGQAAAARREADETRRAAEVQTRAYMAERVRTVRWGIIRNEYLWREWSEANPQFAQQMAQHGGAEVFIMMRDFLDAMQDVYFLRKAGIATDHDWRSWTGAMLPTARTPTFRAVYAQSLERGLYEPEFVAAMQPALDGQRPTDPLGRVT